MAIQEDYCFLVILMNMLASHIFNPLTKYDCDKILVAQIYNGTDIIFGEHYGLWTCQK